MQYCRKCIQPDTRPGIVFDDKGVCVACRIREEIPRIDWSEGKKQLQDIAEWAKRADSLLTGRTNLGGCTPIKGLRRGMARSEKGQLSGLCLLGFPIQGVFEDVFALRFFFIGTIVRMAILGVLIHEGARAKLVQHRK